MFWELRDDCRIYGKLDFRTFPIPSENVEKSAKGLQFKCLRYDDVLESKRLYDFFKNAVEGNAHLDIDKERGNWGVLEEDLVPINRKTEPKVFFNFENQVIHALTKSLKSPFKIELAIYSPGQLLGTEILLFRLIDYLKRNRASGEIQLFLIDPRYQKAISDKPVGHIFQFVKDLCRVLPSSITVQGTFFASSEDYLQMANQDPNYKNHLLIGPETAKGLEELTKTGKIKLGKNIKTCELKLPGKFEDFYPFNNRVTAFEAIKQNPLNKESDDSTMTLILGGGVVLCIAIGVAFLARRALNSTS